jgi:uncharacterized SAM-binding protein YcdF (DUF218 family)
MFLSPLAFGLLLALGMIVGWRRSPRALRWVAAVAACLLIVSICPLGANALVWQIESRVPEPAACSGPAPTTIVVLAAGFEREPADADDFAALESDSIRRALAGIELWRRTPGATLVFAGGGPFATSESAALQRLAELAGVPVESLRREDRSQTTWENAQQLHALAPALPARIWLVSSALHLPRALIAFRTAGFQPCAYASDRRYIPPGGVGYYLPQSSALIKTEAAIHEMAGAALYRWRAANAARGS